MLFDRKTFIGIDPTAGTKPFTYAALDTNLQLLALGSGSLDEVTAFAGGQREAVVAVNAPRQINQGLMNSAAHRATLSPIPHTGRWTSSRVAEFLLYQHNINIFHTPNNEEDCPRWMLMGFAVFLRLERLGYHLYPNSEAAGQLLETYPHAAYSILLGQTPFPKYNLEGRIQRQLVLHNRGLHISDPMNFFEEITRHRLLNGILPTDHLMSAAELDALVAAYVAWFATHSPDETTLLGDPTEGQIVLPGAPLKPRYA